MTSTRINSDLVYLLCYLFRRQLFLEATTQRSQNALGNSLKFLFKRVDQLDITHYHILPAVLSTFGTGRHTVQVQSTPNMQEADEKISCPRKWGGANGKSNLSLTESVRLRLALTMFMAHILLPQCVTNLTSHITTYRDVFRLSVLWRGVPEKLAQRRGPLFLGTGVSCFYAREFISWFGNWLASRLPNSAYIFLVCVSVWHRWLTPPLHIILIT
jgi:hypothetical protein